MKWKLNVHGFSLIELMLTVSFVLLGSLLIQGAFMRSSEMFGRYTHTLSVMSWADQESTKAFEALLYTREGAPSQESGSIELAGRSYDWSQTVKETGAGLYSIDTSVRWTEGGKPQEYHHEIYAFKKELLPGI